MGCNASYRLSFSPNCNEPAFADFFACIMETSVIYPRGTVLVSLFYSQDQNFASLRFMFSRGSMVQLMNQSRDAWA